MVLPVHLTKQSDTHTRHIRQLNIFKASSNKWPKHSPAEPTCRYKVSFLSLVVSLSQHQPSPTCDIITMSSCMYHNISTSLHPYTHHISNLFCVHDEVRLSSPTLRNMNGFNTVCSFLIVFSLPVSSTVYIQPSQDYTFHNSQ